MAEVAQYISVIKDVITGIAALVAAVVAIRGLRTWNRQLAGNANYDLAKRVLASTLKVREEIRRVRNPFILGGEMQRAKIALTTEDPSQDVKNLSDEAAVYQLRFNKLNGALLELDTNLLEAEILWKVDSTSITGPSKASITELYMALRDHLKGTQARLEPARWDEAQAIIYSNFQEGKDTFAAKADGAIATIQRIAIPYIESLHHR